MIQNIERWINIEWSKIKNDLKLGVRILLQYGRFLQLCFSVGGGSVVVLERILLDQSIATPPPRRIGIHKKSFSHENFYGHKFFTRTFVPHYGNFQHIEIFHSFLDYFRLGLFTWKIRCTVFSWKSGNITHILVEFEPLITNMVVPLRGDLPVRSCAAPKVPLQNVWAKYTGNIFVFQTGQNYNSQDSTRQALSKSQQQQNVKM